jgi:hypothetical protein
LPNSEVFPARSAHLSNSKIHVGLDWAVDILAYRGTGSCRRFNFEAERVILISIVDVVIPIRVLVLVVLNGCRLQPWCILAGQKLVLTGDPIDFDDTRAIQVGILNIVVPIFEL